MYEIKKASSIKSKARILISGIAKSGKTYTALTFAKAFGSKTLVLDTKFNSSTKYSDLFDFDVIDIRPPYNPQSVVDIISITQTKGYDTLIIDSISLFWGASGGFLDIHQDLTNKRRDKNSFAAWQDLNPIYEDFINAILQSNIHIIATVRQKSDYVIDKDANGKTQIRKAGIKIEFRDNFEFNFDVLLQMTQDHYAIIEGSRFPDWDDQVFKHPTSDTAKPLLEWLNKGEKKKLKTFTKEIEVLMKAAIKDGDQLLVAERLVNYDVPANKKEEINKLILKKNEEENNADN
jgi:hypothetical protein